MTDIPIFAATTRYQIAAWLLMAVGLLFAQNLGAGWTGSGENLGDSLTLEPDNGFCQERVVDTTSPFPRVCPLFHLHA